ncbi:MAG: site-specific DNA-methyltransferase [Dehalococcoidia bacterium]
MNIADKYDGRAKVSLHQGDCLDLLAQIPSGSAQLVVTSPPYNIGKTYEKRRRALEDYLAEQAEVIAECVRVLHERGSICWEVGNHIAGPQEVLPLDIALHPIFASHDLKLRNRIVWHFEHGLHCSKRLSGRYETILWYTKGDDYLFDLDPIRVPQKYPGKKQFKGPNAGKLSCNPLGKNPSDVWIFPNVKHNHVEKTIHPCQFPVELVERLVLALTREGDLVVDPYMGVGTTAVAALKHRRRSAGAENVGEYVTVARDRIRMAQAGLLRTRPMTRPVYQPNGNSSVAKREGLQTLLLDVNSEEPNGNGRVISGMGEKGSNN